LILSGATLVAMMESAYVRDRDDPSRIRWMDWAWLGRVLPQTQVCRAPMIVGPEPLQVQAQALLVEHNPILS
jgi:hypothetical protein